MTNRTPWTPAENVALCRLYFTMLDAALDGRDYNKAALIRSAQGAGDQWQNDSHDADGNAVLRNRSRGSIEAKLMNASAAHRDLVPGAETMDGHGYRALANYQAALKEAMADALAARGHRSQELTAHYVKQRVVGQRP